jgi:ABC-2 type transport system ATP-binding protein
MGTQAAITLNHLTKSYGKSRGIEDVSLEIYPGEVFGFLGPNGAGKTTAIRTLLGLIKATSGSAQILGYNALESTAELRARVGYLPGALSLYENYTTSDLLKFFARMRNKNCDRAITEYSARLNLDLNRKVSELSKGNCQKIGVVQAFMHEPDVLFLDEPTGGLDPLAQREFETILEEVKTRGAAVMLSSHVLSEVEHLASRVAIINEGRLLVVDQISTLKDKALRTIDLFFEKPVSIELFTSVPGIKNISARGNSITCTVIGAETILLRVAVENEVVSVQTHEPSLEEIFLHLVEKSVST